MDPDETKRALEDINRALTMPVGRLCWPRFIADLYSRVAKWWDTQCKDWSWTN